jgi:hypothetical protein
MNTARPSEVRERILDEHRIVREDLDELWLAADLVPEGGPPASKHALELSQKLHDELLEQIALELRILSPALLEADAWGSIHVDRLLRRHAGRRVELQKLRSSMARWTGSSFSRELRQFIAGRRAKMLDQERELVTVNLLRDDVGGIDVAAG